MIRVALVDDQKLVRAGFRMVIDSQPDLEVVIEADDGQDALDAILPAARAGEVDVVLMDIRMPRIDGIGATERLTAAGELPRVIVLTTFDLDEYVLAAIRAGASGFLLKDAPPEEMLAAIRTVHAGDAVIAPSSTACRRSSRPTTRGSSSRTAADLPDRTHRTRPAGRRRRRRYDASPTPSPCGGRRGPDPGATRPRPARP